MVTRSSIPRLRTAAPPALPPAAAGPELGRSARLYALNRRRTIRRHRHRWGTEDYVAIALAAFASAMVLLALGSQMHW